MSARALSPGYEILWYTIDSVLGQGGFGITYLAHDRNLNRAVAIKEYLPTTFAYRREDYSVKPITGGHEDNFLWGLGSFQKEAQTLARFSHPNIVRVHSVFEANNTAYMVMEYEHGQNLAELFKASSTLEQSLFERVFFPIFDGLKEIHKFEFIHRDIKPANIYIREDGTPVLIDFGSARQTTQQQTGEMTTLVSQGYTPLEQYSANYGDQGPWTDIYALAATIYQGVVGSKPDESLSRSACLMRAKPDLLKQLDSDVYPGFSQRFLDAVFAGLKLQPEDRPQTIEDWYQLFDGGVTQVAKLAQSEGLVDPDKTRLNQQRPPPESGVVDMGLLNDTGRRPTLSERSGRAGPGSDTETRVNAFGRRAQSGTDVPRSPVDESLDFDDLDFGDDDLSFSNNSRAAERSGPATVPGRRGKKKRNGALVAAVASLIALGAAGAGYIFFTSPTPTTEITKTAENEVSEPIGITQATLSSMPRPPQPIPFALAADNTRVQLQDMTRLAPMLAQAYSLNPVDPVLLDTIRKTESSLISIAAIWNATRYAEVARLINTVSDALPRAVHDREQVRDILDASSRSSGYSEVFGLIDRKHYLSPPGNSLLDRVSSLDLSEFQQLKSTPQWQNMMSELSMAAMDKLSRSEYDDAARLTEAALTMDAEHPGFNTLKDWLTSP